MIKGETMTIWHNPRCSKSRQCLAWLEEHSDEIEIVKYLETPPSANALKEVLSMLGMAPRELMRVKEKEYKELGLQDTNLSDDALIEAMVKTPKLIERPIVIYKGKAALGRPLENVMELVQG